MVNNIEALEVEIAERQWAELSNEAQDSLKAIVGWLNHPVYGISVTKLANGWFVLEHPSKEYKVQMTVVAIGSNLDMSIFTQGNAHYAFSGLTSVKLNEDNIKFAVQRALAIFGLHNRVSTSDNSVAHNDDIERKFQEEYNFIKTYS